MPSIAPRAVKPFSWPVVASGHLFWMLFVAFLGTVNAAVYDLSSDWSNSSNPNGPWSYNQGSTPLPFVPNFNFGGTGWVSSCNQPAWAPSNATGDYLPAFLKVDACVTTTENTEYPLANVMAGDVWVHTVDGSNGNPSLGAANVLFTLPASGGAGSYTISGSLWDSLSSSPTSDSRPQDWSLFLNGARIATGVLSGNVFRSQAQTFSMVENLNVGDQVKLQIVEDPAAPAGFIVSINLTISPAGAPPGPVTVFSPAQGASGVVLTPALIWGSVAGATSYDVYLGTSPTPPFVTNTTGTSYSPAALNPNTTYYWYLVSVNAAGSTPSAKWSFTTGGSSQPAFFAGEASLGSGVYYLQFPDGNLFGYYNFPATSILYHYDMGFEAYVPGSASDIYLYDFSSGHWWYTSTGLFPYLYDFTLRSWVYYFPNPADSGHYTTNPRYFSNLTTGQVFTM